ncbi:MAG: filamentation induced by cAMP protein Fic [uncultured bacterium]|nr:MAG: filamentation induced by cAMP protein Fic [uncultured bacterium]
MKISEKLHLIIKITKMTQQELAERIGISFVALNNLINNKSQARKKTQNRINELYLEYSGMRHIPNNILSAKKNIIRQKSKINKNVLKIILNNENILKQIILSLTYNSNKIEGSTLTENETAAIIFDNIALPNKTLIEQLEAKNHQTSLMYLLNYLLDKKSISEDLILRLHSILLSGINPDAGFYRRHAVRIIGVNVATANYLKIPELMKKLMAEINKKEKDIISQTVKIHSQFEQIHPFVDGNGRIGRLILQAMILEKNIAPAIIKQENKIFYMRYLNISQIKNDFSLFEDFLCEAILEGYKIIEE